MTAAFDTAPLDCGETDWPGRDERNPLWREWSERESTFDQLRIEAWLETQPLEGAALLHLGCGNSKLAARFLPRLARIDGVTISHAEHALGQSLRLPGYTVRLLNKYSPALAAFGGGYRYIVDNNPSSFACCRRHLEFLFATCAQLLAPGGALITDKFGLQHVITGGIKALSMSFDDLAVAGAALGLQAQRESDTIYTLRKRPA